MISGLCESPLTFQAIIIWRDELNEGKVFLRDIIDLEATYAGPDAKSLTAPPPGVAAPLGPTEGESETTEPEIDLANAPPPVAVAPPAAPAEATPFKPASGSQGPDGRPEPSLGEADLEDDDLENSLSLAAIEAELKPKVLETFDRIAETYKRLRRLQDQDIENRLKNQSLSPAQERKYLKLKEELVAEVKSLRLNQARLTHLSSSSTISTNGWSATRAA